LNQRYLNGFELKKEAYSTREVAEIFGVTPQTVINWIRAGRINGVMLAPTSKKAKTDRGRYQIYSDGLHDLELRRDELIRASMRYWPSLLAKMSAAG
jgi:DNA-binding transcriptional MerR regulator